MQIALTIAGFDPGSGAGVSADLAVFSAHRAFGVAAVSALTVQSTLGVKGVAATAPDFLAATLDELAADFELSGIKIGMLASKACVDAAADFLIQQLDGPGRVPVVLDPVLVSSSGAALLESEGIAALIDRLVPLATWVTPNRQEWRVLTGAQEADEQHRNFEVSAQELRQRWPSTGFIITGGDGEQADDLVLPPGGKPVWMRAHRIESTSTHGTGCAFSSALLCGLIEGRDGASAALAAKHYVREAILRAAPIGHGRGPLNLLWPLTATG